MVKSFFLIGSDDRMFELPGDRGAMIGRSASNQIVLDDRMVSRVHASIAPSPNGPVVTDRKSGNGTQVNGLPVEEQLLKHGDTVRIGKFLLYVFSGTRGEAEQWMSRRKSDTKTDQTITDLNVNQLRPTDMFGDLSAFDIMTLLQTLVDQRRSGMLELTDAGKPVGRIFFTNGMIVYADSPAGLKGKEALFDLMTTQKGQFRLQNEARPPTLSIMENPTALLMEGARLYDEKRAQIFQR
jgi:pSer/pThr/pTyr-binding forkhead associated (FHA) protein